MPNICNIFIAYSGTDIDYLNALRNHLKALEHSGKVRVWYDGEIDAGSDWKATTQQALETANIILLLISSDAIASDDFYSAQLPACMDRYRAGEAHLIPIIVRPCHWQTMPVGQLKSLPQHGKPVSSWANQDEAWAEVIAYLERVVQKVLSPGSGTLDAPAGLGLPAAPPPVSESTGAGSRTPPGRWLWLLGLLLLAAAVGGGIFWFRSQRKQTEVKLWQEQQKNPTAQGLQQYLDQYPEGLYIHEAKAQLDAVNEETAWKKAQSIDDIPAYKAFLKSYGNGKNQREAIERLRVLQNSLELHLQDAEIYLKNKMNPDAQQEISAAAKIDPLDERVIKLMHTLK